MSFDSTWAIVLLLFITAAFSVAMGKLLDHLRIPMWAKWAILFALFFFASIALYGIVGPA